MADINEGVHIHWVVALRPEAEAIIQSLKMKPVRVANGGFPVWKSEPAHGSGEREVVQWLVLSGLGKMNAAAATAWLQITSGSPTTSGWINFGIAGHRDIELGSVVRANRITDRATEKSWFPAAVWKRKFDLKSAGLRTIDAPSTEYPETGEMIDMEASGMISTAIRFSSVELIQSVKVISDNAESDIAAISKQTVRTDCAAAFEQIQPWLTAFEAIAVAESERTAEPGEFAELLRQFRFSETQTHMLRKLLQRHQALGSFDAGQFKDCATAKDVIACLSDQSHRP